MLQNYLYWDIMQLILYIKAYCIVTATEIAYIFVVLDHTATAYQVSVICVLLKQVTASQIQTLRLKRRLFIFLKKRKQSVCS